MSIVIGINSFHADSAAAIFKDDELLFAIEEEKLNRKKHWAGFPKLSILKCLEYSQIDKDMVTDIALNSNPLSNLHKKVPSFLRRYIIGQKKFEILNRVKNKIKIKDYFVNELNFSKEINIHYIDHHLSHIASSFYPSNFDEALAVSIDGFGDFASVNIALCNRNEIKILDKFFFPESLGIFYEAMTQFLGFENYGDEYKLMGLAAYGKPVFFDEIINNLFEKSEKIKLNQKYFNHTNKNFSYKFDGIPKQNKIYSEKIFEIFSEKLVKEKNIDFAASIQKVYEFFFIKILKFALTKYKSNNLCLSGGCGLNSSANGKIIDELNFSNIFLPYAPADGGGAIGSALICLKKKKKINNFKNLTSPYIGPFFKEKEIFKALKKIDLEKFKIQKFDEIEKLNEVVAKKISESRIVGWFQDRIEFGARALGNRSILADPRNKDIREIINSKIKKREDFRPFAPSVLSEHKDDWFKKNAYNNSYMEAVLKIKNEKKDIVPSIVHVDGTCRVQSVSFKNNLKFYNLIKNFFKLTNVPILLNTSFNENEPIVCSPEEAIDCFLRTKMDDLVLGDKLISRKN